MIIQSPARGLTQALLCLPHRAHLWQLHLPGAPLPLRARPHPPSPSGRFSAPGLLVAASEQPGKTAVPSCRHTPREHCEHRGCPGDSSAGALSSPPLRRWAPQSTSTAWPGSQGPRAQLRHRVSRHRGSVSAPPHSGLCEEDRGTRGLWRRVSATSDPLRLSVLRVLPVSRTPPPVRPSGGHGGSRLKGGEDHWVLSRFYFYSGRPVGARVCRTPVHTTGREPSQYLPARTPKCADTEVCGDSGTFHF